MATDDRGFVETDEYLRTTVPGIWALGDIAGHYQLKHNANLEAAHVANNVLNRFRLPVDVIARSIYIHPALPEVMQAAFASVAQRVARVSDHNHDEAHSEDEHGTAHAREAAGD